MERMTPESEMEATDVQKQREALRLKAFDVTVRRGGSTLLHGIHFAAASMEVVGVLGPSGGGKSTLLYALIGFRPIQGGRVELGGRDVHRSLEALKHEIGFVPQDDVVPGALKVERVLHYAAQLRLPQLSDEARAGRIAQVLRRLELYDKRHLRVSKLSGGQRKRVSIATELLARPSVLVADEPTSGLDPALEHTLMAVFRRMADEGHLVILTTHIMASLAMLDAVCLLKDGHVAYFGPPGSLKAYFGVEDFADIYRKLGEKPGSKWHERYLTDELCRQYLKTRLSA